MRMIVSFLFILLAIVGGVAAAQDIPVFCGDLSDDDCALLTETTQTMADLESVVFHMDMSFAMSGIPHPTMNSITIHINGDGALAMDTEALGALFMSPEAMMENVEELPRMFEQAIEAISADVTLVIEIPEEVIFRYAIPMRDRVSLSARLVDGFAYINLDKLVGLDPYGSMPRGWQGIDLAGFYRALLEQQMDVFSSMSGLSAMSTFANPEFLSNFMTIERLEDTEIDGQPAAVFATALDYDALFSDPAMQEYLRSSLAGMSGFTGEKPDEDMIDMMMNMYSQMFDGLVLEMTQTVGLDDHYVHRLGMHLDWTPNFGAMMGMSSGTDVPEMNFVFDMQVDLARFNDAPAITAPEDANIYPLDLMIPNL